MLPVTPLRNGGGWGRIRTGCLWSFTPALFLMSFPTVIRESKIEDRGLRIEDRESDDLATASDNSIFCPPSSILDLLSSILYLPPQFSMLDLNSGARDET